jgi:Xaa-Pro aminopeptidase
LLVLISANLVFAQDLRIFKERREILIQKMGKGIGLVFAGEEFSEDRFDVNPDFYYLTGLDDEPGAILILAPAEKKRKEVLLLKPRNPEEERWEGERLSIGEELRKKTGLKYIRRTDGLAGWLNRFLHNCDTLCVLSRPAAYTSPVPEDLKILGELQSRWLGKTLKDCSRLITEMRSIKSQNELDLMSKAVRVTEASLKNVFAKIHPGMNEEDV